jgi:hypothetical protein
VRGVHSAFLSGGDAPAVLVLRGESTLRGHVAVEMRALGPDEAVGLVVPAYPEAGRVTVGGVHYLDSGDDRALRGRTSRPARHRTRRSSPT